MSGSLIENWGDPVLIQTHIPAIIPRFSRLAAIMWFKSALLSFVALTQHPASFGFSSSPSESKNVVKKNDSTLIGL